MKMRAVQCEAYGEPETLVVREVDAPEARGTQVVVQVHGSGLNFADMLMVQGLYQVKPPLPFTPGQEFSGVITAIGEDVTDRRVGQRVMGMTPWGAWAEYVATDASATIPMPDNMSFEHGAAFPIIYGTSHVGLERRGRLEPGEWLLVHGAAGGVGLTAVELGKKMGAKVIATASTQEKLDLAASRGADVLINYREQAFKDEVKRVTGGEGADVIYDPVGGDVFDQSLRCIAWEGRLLTIGYASGRIPEAPANRMLIKNCAVVGVFWGAYMMRDPGVLAKSFATLTRWYAEGALNPHVGDTYGLEEVADGLIALRERRAMGKLVMVTGAKEEG